MAADHAPEKALMPEMVETSPLSISLPPRIDECQVLGLTTGQEVLLIAGEKQLLEPARAPLGEADPDEAAGRDGVAIPDQPNGLGCGHDLAPLARAQRGQKRMGGQT